MQTKRSPQIDPADAYQIVQIASSFLSSIEKSGQKFDVELEEVYSSILAHPLERFVCNVFSKKYPNVNHNGKPGRHDVLFQSLNYELEVKTTQDFRSLKADVDTWPTGVKKNIIYFVRNPNRIDEWMVILFEGLTREMFGKEGKASVRSKGKATLKKWKAWENSKVTILVGSVKVSTRNYKSGPRKCFSPIYDRVDILEYEYFDPELECLVTVLKPYEEENWNFGRSDETGSSGSLGTDPTSFEKL